PPRGCRRAGCRGQQNTRRGVGRGCGLRRLVGGALVGLGVVGTRCPLRQTETAQLAGGLSVYRASASTPAPEPPVKKRTIFGLILIVTALLGLVLLARTSGTRLVGLLLGEQFPYDMPAGHWVALLHSEERGNRERALDAVLILGPVAREAAPALAGMLND